MVRLGKLTDYGLVLMTCLARGEGPGLRTARDLAIESSLPLPTVTRLLKELLHQGLLTSHRGMKGGYTLARRAGDISVIEIIAALEGPVALTECSTDIEGMCGIEPCCPIKSNQRIINQAVRGVLGKLTLSDLVQPLELASIRDAQGHEITTITPLAAAAQAPLTAATQAPLTAAAQAPLTAATTQAPLTAATTQAPLAATTQAPLAAATQAPRRPIRAAAGSKETLQ